MQSTLMKRSLFLFFKNKTQLLITFGIFILFLSFPFFVKSQNIVINEFMASNATFIEDEFGNMDDWVELYNPTNAPVNIGGMYVTDDLLEPTQWQIPTNAPQTTTIPAGGYLLLWFDKEPAQGPLHVDAKLGASGEDIAIFASNGSLIDSRTYSQQFADISEGRDPNGGSNWDFYPDPTPNAANDTDPGLVLADEPTSSKSSGLYNGTQSVTLSTSTPNGTIHYTTDGSVPTESSPQYTGPISISQNTPLRAVTVADGFEDSNPATFNFLIDVNHTVPVITITAGDDLLFDPATGMYPNFEEDIEIPAHVEMIETNGTVGFSQIAEIEIHGSASAFIPQKSIALKAKKSLGGKEFPYSVFPDLGFDAYRSLIVRNSGQDNNLSMFRDALVSSLVRDLSDVNGIITKPDLHTQGFRPSVVYINGEYWGIYNLRERSDKRYLKVHFDLDDDEIDLIDGFDEVKEGDINDWNDLLNYLNATDFTSDANFEVLKTRVDADHFLDYNVFNVYNDNHDWPENNNRRWRERDGDGRWKYLTYDLDFTFGLFTAQGWNSGAWYNNSLARLLDEFSNSWPNNKVSTLLFRKMIQNKKWRTDFVNRMADQLNVLYNADRINGRISTFKSVYAPEMPQHIDRWAGFILWDDHISKLNTFANGRVESVRGHVVSAFSDVAGTANVTLNASPANGGQVKFSTLTLGQNEFPFDGVYFTGMDIPVEAVANPGYVFTGWSVGSMGSNPSTTINLSGDISITANFEPVGNQQSQSISFSSIPNKQTTDGPFQVNANASSGLPVSLSITSGPATISGNTITLTGNTGTVTVLATQNGNANYLPAPNVTRTFNVTETPGGNGPTVVLSTSSLNVDGPFTVNIDFNESVNDLTLAEVVVNNGTKSNPAGFGSSYSFTVTPNNFGIVSISIPAGSAFNGSGEPNQVSNTLEVNYDDPNNNEPTVNITTNSLNVTGSFDVNVQFSESVSNFQLADIQVSNGTQSNSSGSGANYNFTVTPTNTGLVTIFIPAGVANNNNGNPNQASNTLEVNYTNSNNNGPTVNVTTSSLNVTSSFNVNVQFSEGVSNFQLADIQVSNGSKSNPSTSGSANYSFTVTPNNDGLVTIFVPAGAANNNTGVPSQASNTLEVNYTAPGSGGCSTTENLALGRPATQSGTQQNGSASRAVDGNTDGMAFSNNSVSITNWQQHAWWQIDLGEVSTIEEIKIWNREDCCEDKLQNYHVLISENPFNSTDLNATIAQSGVINLFESQIAQRPTTISVNESGRYVRIQLAGSAFLALAEVEIIGCQDGNGGPQNQSINFANLPNRLTSDPSFSLNATASSGLPVSFQLISGPASISGNTLTLNGSAGTVTVRASQAGNANYNAAPSITRNFNVTEGGGNSNYCESYAEIQTSEWIQSVVFNDIINSSGVDGGYGDYTNLSTTLQAGASYPIVLTPGYANTQYQEAWRVWIDFNQDGDFQDANELIFEGAGNVPLSGNVTIPQSVDNGPTRMRISMKWNSAANDCSVFNFGEVEDYTVNISGGTGSLIAFIPNNVLASSVEKGLNVKAYPNPVEHLLIVDHTTSKSGILNLMIHDMQGNVVYEKQREVLVGGDRYVIDVSDFPAGTYTLFLKQGSQQKVIRVIKIRD